MEMEWAEFLFAMYSSDQLISSYHLLQLIRHSSSGQQFRSCQDIEKDLQKISLYQKYIGDGIIHYSTRSYNHFSSSGPVPKLSYD